MYPYPYTFDVERIPLTREEQLAFTKIVVAECSVQDQHGFSSFLAALRGPCGPTLCDTAASLVTRIWRR